MEKFLIYTRTPWNEPPRARHQFSRGLAKTHTVYFIEANSRSFVPGFSITPEENNLFLIRTSWYFDYRIRYRIPVLNKMYQRWLFGKLKQSGLTGNHVTLITFDHTSSSIVKSYTNAVYYVNDDHTRAGHRSHNYFQAQHIRSEKEIAAKSKMIVVTSKGLLHKFDSHGDKTVEIPLGAPAIETLQQHSGTQRHRIALVGYINEKRTPMRLLSELAQHPDYELYLIGPCSESIRSALASYENVLFTGPKVGAELHDLLQRCSVGIAPYRMEDINEGATPNKLWLYLGNGLPAVVTRIPNIDSWEFPEGFVYKASESNDDFPELVAQALKENSSDLRKQRFAFSQQHNWNARTNDFLKQWDSKRSVN